MRITKADLPAQCPSTHGPGNPRKAPYKPRRVPGPGCLAATTMRSDVHCCEALVCSFEMTTRLDEGNPALFMQATELDTHDTIVAHQVLGACKSLMVVLASPFQIMLEHCVRFREQT